MVSFRGFVLLIGIYFYCCINSITGDIKISTHDVELIKGGMKEIFLEISNYNYNNTTIEFLIQHKDIVQIEPNPVKYLEPNHTISLQVKAVGAGHSDIYADNTNRKDLGDVFLRVTIRKEPILDTISLVIGWIYFVAWSVSFYPQIYINWKRQSVVGLNFDFLALNFIGFFLYSIFNLGLYFIEELKVEYSRRHPRGLNPVQVNDIFFSVHAVLATSITIVQCFIYQRDEQKVSLSAKGIISAFTLFLFASCILVFTNTINWLDLLYYCSYVKLAITLIKYLPQAFMNYKRKSTVGWSIGNIFLDFTGGTLSMFQMILNAYNYDDWISIFGDLTKFGLGLFSVVFDIFFIVQHYFIYRRSNYHQNP